MDIEKEDGQSEQCICQLKSTDKQSISIKQNDIHILEQNAAIAHKLPVFAIQFLNTNEVWVMIKPEDLKLIQSLVKGEDISEQLKFGVDLVDLGVDNEDKTSYNFTVSSSGAGKSYIARQAYAKQREEEADRENREYKQRLKRAREKQRERRKQIGKEV